MEVLIEDTIFTPPTGDGTDRHFMWSSEPREGPAACSANTVPSLLSIGPAPGIEPATYRSTVKRSTD